MATAVNTLRGPTGALREKIEFQTKYKGIKNLDLCEFTVQSGDTGEAKQLSTRDQKIPLKQKSNAQETRK